MSLQEARERKLSCSDGALNLRQELISKHRRDEKGRKSKDESYFNSKEGKKGRRKEAITNIPDIMSRFLRHKNSQSNKNRKESLFSRVLSGGDRRSISEYENSYFLRCAVRKQDTERVIELASQHDTNINGANQKGITSLHEAAIDGNFVCLKILVSHGADVNRTDYEGFTPLDYAVFGGNFECASYLIEKGAGVDRIRDGQIVNRDELAARMIYNRRSYIY